MKIHLMMVYCRCVCGLFFEDGFVLFIIISAAVLASVTLNAVKQVNSTGTESDSLII